MPKGHPGTNSRIDYRCPTCGKIFQDLKCKKRVYCSRSCAGKAPFSLKNIDRTGKKISKDSRVKMSKSFKKHLKKIGKSGLREGTKATLEHRINQSCSRRGIKREDFNGFAKDKDTLERVKFRNEIQEQVLKRDNYTCQLCGKRGVFLHVDHIQPWAKYIEGRFDINNCRTLCMKCHYKLTFGRDIPEGVTWGHNLKYKLKTKGDI